MRNLKVALATACAVVVGWAFTARAEAIWTTGTWSTFTAAEGNLIKGKMPSAYKIATTTGEGAKNVAVFTDGEGPTQNGKSTCVGNGATFTYEFDYPSRVDELRFYTSAWSGRNNITISAIRYRAVDGNTFTVEGGSVNYATGGASCGYAYFRNGDGSPLFDLAESVTIEFGTQENGYVGFVEIEVLGTPENYRRIAVTPVGAAVPTPDVGLEPFTPNVECTLTAPAGPLVDESRFFLCTFEGYDLVYADGTVQHGETPSITFAPSQPYTLTWKYAKTVNPEKDVPSRALIGNYVQDGFFSFWDVLYNVGTNAEHSNSATVWKDIVGNHDLSAFTTPGGATISLPAWEDERAVWDGRSNGQAFAWAGGTDEFLLDSNSNITLELVGECENYSGNNLGLFVMSPNGSSYTYGAVSLGCRLALSTLYCSYGNGQDASFPFSAVKPGNGSYAVTFVTEGKNVKLYYRGELYKTIANQVTAKKIKTFVLGPSCYGDYLAGAKFALRGVRLYNRPLTAGEVRHNHAIDEARYYGGKLGDTVVRASGSPANYGAPSPAYGTTVFTAGNDLPLSVGLLKTYEDGIRGNFVADDERAVYLGYAVATGGVVVASGAEESASWTILNAAPGSITMDWLWRREFQVTAAQSGYPGCKVEIVGATSGGAQGGSTSAWVPNGATVTIRAVACEGAKFSGWAGDTGGIADITAEETTLTVDHANAISAVFVEGHHEPTTVTLKAGASGSWFDAANWEGGSAPQEGDTVLLTPADGTSPTLELTAATPPLAKVVVSNGADNCKTVLKCANWLTCIDAAEVIVGKGGVIASAGGFYDTAMSNRVWIAAQALTVDAGGAILAENAGWAPGNGTCRTLVGSPNGSDGGAYGGLGGDIWSGDFAAGDKTARTYGDAEWPTDPGCGRKSDAPAASSLAQAGGGAIRLDVEGPVVINGKISSDCTSIGGSGGSVLIVCTTIDGTGTVSACAARGFTSAVGGGGGGGRIAVHYDPSAQAAKDATCGIAFRACGGYSTEEYLSTWMRMGGPGSLWFSDARFITAAGYAGHWPFSGELSFGTGDTEFDCSSVDVTMDGDQLFFPSACTFRCRSLAVTGPSWARAYGLVFSDSAVTVDGDAAFGRSILWLTGGSLDVVGDLTLAAGTETYKGGELWLDAAITNTPGQYGVTCTVGGALTVGRYSILCPRCHRTNNSIPHFAVRDFYLEADGKVDGKGWGSSGKAVPATAIGGAGTSHGGRGAADGDRSIYCYGNEKRPVCPGSGCDSRGGSVFYLESTGCARLDGVIDCSAKGGTAGGSGGSVYLYLPRILPSSGSVLACGGSGTFGAGGGRIAVYSRMTIPSEITFSAACGTSSKTYAYPAQNGTVYLHQFRGLSIFVR